ncbi:hypothetical protein [Halomonas urmiana]|uniref:hypothetical protein n=1 Tax=Halomonas urmiana TaxID=490901 RepID=UPI001F00A1F0|nr:hypothetical protein [Halomonas urmiana]
MRKALLALTLGLVTSTTFAAGEHAGSHAPAGDADIDRTIRLEAGDMWFDAESLNLRLATRSASRSPTPVI